MQPPLVSIFHETVSSTFDHVLDYLGQSLKTTIVKELSVNGVPMDNVSGMFHDVENVLIRLFGERGREILAYTLEGLYEDYSIPSKVDHDGMPSERLRDLNERVLINHLYPKSFRGRADIWSYEDNTGTGAAWSD